MAILMTILFMTVHVIVGMGLASLMSSDTNSFLVLYAAYMSGTLGATFYSSVKLNQQGEKNEQDQN